MTEVTRKPAMRITFESIPYSRAKSKMIFIIVIIIIIVYMTFKWKHTTIKDHRSRLYIIR